MVGRREPRSRAGGRPRGLPGVRQPDRGIPAAREPAVVRGPKIVTIIFSDLKGSTALTEKIDAEAINEVKERYFSSMAAEIERHGGKIEKYIGDAIMAVFGLPKAHEDDALRAVRAAHGMTQALHRLNKELLEFYGVEIAARTGVNTGEVVANSDPNAEQRLATGDAVNVAARLEQAAPANEVLIGEVTYDLVHAYVDVEQVEPLELKGKAERVPAYRLVDVRDATALVEPSAASDAPLVGSRGAAGAPAGRPARRRRSRRGAPRDRARRSRGRQVVPRGHLPARGPSGDHRPAWPMPSLRRRHHVLAARGDDPRGDRDR